MVYRGTCCCHSHALVSTQVPLSPSASEDHTGQSGGGSCFLCRLPPLHQQLLDGCWRHRGERWALEDGVCLIPIRIIDAIRPLGGGSTSVWPCSFLQAADRGEDDLLLFQPHTRPVACLRFSGAHASHLLSLSYDGSLRCMDVEKAVFDDVRHVFMLNRWLFSRRLNPSVVVAGV